MGEYVEKNIKTERYPLGGMVVYKKSGVIYDKRFKRVIKSLEYLKSSNDTITKIQVYEREGTQIKYFGASWRYQIHKDMSKEANALESNREALKFLEGFQSKTNIELFFKIFFEFSKSERKKELHIHQRNIPGYFEKNGKVVQQNSFIYLGWYYKEAKELCEWIKTNDYIINSIQVFYTSGREIVYFGTSWHYHGDRNKSKEKNIHSNFLSAADFMESIHSTSRINLLYEICFESEKDMDEIDRDFYYKSIIESGHDYTLEDALEIIERCRSEDREIIGIEVFKITQTYIQPIDMRSYNGDEEEIEPPEYFERFHIKKNHDTGNWDKASQFIKESSQPECYFQIAYE